MRCAVALYGILGCAESPPEDDPPPGGDADTDADTDADADTDTDADTDSGTETDTAIDHAAAAEGTYTGQLRIECSQGYILVITDTCTGDFTATVSPPPTRITGSGSCAFGSFARELGPQNLTIDGGLDFDAAALGTATSESFLAAWYGGFADLTDDSYASFTGSFYQSVDIEAYPTDCGAQWLLVRE